VASLLTLLALRTGKSDDFLLLDRLETPIVPASAVASENSLMGSIDWASTILVVDQHLIEKLDPR
jgi:hypothetical protein